LEISTKSIVKKIDRLWSLHDREQVREDELKSSIATLVEVTTQETQPESPCCQQVCDEVEEAWSGKSLAPQTLSVEMKECTEALTQPDLEDEEEVGMEDRDPAMIVNYCRCAMGIYDFELSAE
jgi:hypothetical protein